jgi:hypothetical protein
LSFVIDGVRYFTLADDEMISMRYAENFAAGHGLVWNPGGPRVEGYTNFLWVLYMAFFHWLKVPRPMVSVCIQSTGALLLVANLFCVRELARRVSGGSETAALAAAALVAFYIPLDNWAFQGTEVSLLTLVVSGGCCLVLRRLDSGRTRVLPFLPIYLLLAFGTLVRPDMIVFAVIVLLALAILQPKMAAARLVGGGAIVAIFVALETAFRLHYFGDPLPNAYYLKVSGFPLLPKLSRGLEVTIFFLLQIAPLAAVIWSGRVLKGAGAERTGRRDAGLLLGVFASQIVYSIAVGGDAWESWGGSNRFIAIAMPLFLVCVAAGLVRTWRRGLGRRGLPIALAMSIFIANYTAFLVSMPDDPAGALKHMCLWVKPYETDSLERVVRSAVALRTVTDDRAVVAVVWAGAIPYFSQRQAVDLMGRTDPTIAHEPMHVPEGPRKWIGFHPGHLKWDYRYSLGVLQPDVIQAPLWQVEAVRDESAADLLRPYDEKRLVIRWYLRRDSGHVRWDQIGRTWGR